MPSSTARWPSLVRPSAETSAGRRASAAAAVITEASTGIGFERARIAAGRGYDLVVAADEAAIADVVARPDGRIAVSRVEADLSAVTGVDHLIAAIGGRPVDVLCANGGIALGHAFLQQPVAAWRARRRYITGTLLLLHAVLPRMIARGTGRVLVTGSINGSMPGPYLAVYNATKAFLSNFTDALRDEMRESAVTLPTLMPGPVETAIYRRAGMLDTLVGSVRKPHPAGVARAGWEAMQRGDPHLVPGVANKIVAAAAHITSAAIATAVHRIVAMPR